MTRRTEKAFRGFPVVLTADRTLMGHYPTLLDGMMATVQTTFVPTLVHRRILSPPIRRDGLRVRMAPLGLRKLEAALLDGDFDPDDVAVVAPDDLERAVGAATRVVGLSSGDPLGLGMTGTTMVDMLGGELHTRKAFRQLCKRLSALRRKGLGFRTVAGGPGAWQLADHPRESRELGIDIVFRGYGEHDAARLFGRAAEGDADASFVVDSETRTPAGRHRIRGAASMGVVEISRGCGLGCRFCTLAREPMTHAGIDAIVAEAEVNLRGGPAISLISEDLLRYGGSAAKPDPDALFKMLRAVRPLTGLRMIQVDHVNISSIMQYTDAQLRELRELLRPADSPGQECLWVNLGVESADGRLLADGGMAAKLHPATAETWSEACLESVLRMERAGFMPMVSLVMGLEGETPDSVDKTLAFVRKLRGHRVTVFPIFLASVDPAVASFQRGDMTARHWQLLKESYELNFRWIPTMFADNHAAAGVGGFRRAFIQVAGRFQTLVWKGKFAWNCPRARR